MFRHTRDVQNNASQKKRTLKSYYAQNILSIKPCGCIKVAVNAVIINNTIHTAYTTYYLVSVFGLTCSDLLSLYIFLTQYN